MAKVDVYLNIGTASQVATHIKGNLYEYYFLESSYYVYVVGCEPNCGRSSVTFNREEKTEYFE